MASVLVDDERTFIVKSDWKKYIRKIHNVIMHDYVGITMTEKARSRRVYEYRNGSNVITITLKRYFEMSDCVYTFTVSQNNTDIVSYTSYTTRKIYKKINKLLFHSYYLDGTKVFKSSYF